MTKEQIIAMARKVWGESAILPFDDLERFATLVRNAALEEVKQKLLSEPVELIAKWKAAEAIESLKEPTT